MGVPVAVFGAVDEREIGTTDQGTLRQRTMREQRHREHGTSEPLSPATRHSEKRQRLLCGSRWLEVARGGSAGCFVWLDDAC